MRKLFLLPILLLIAGCASYAASSSFQQMTNYVTNVSISLPQLPGTVAKMTSTAHITNAGAIDFTFGGTISGIALAGVATNINLGNQASVEANSGVFTGNGSGLNSIPLATNALNLVGISTPSIITNGSSGVTLLNPNLTDPQVNGALASTNLVDRLGLKANTNAPVVQNATLNGRTDLGGGIATNGVYSYVAVNRAIYTIGSTNTGLGWAGTPAIIINGVDVVKIGTSPYSFFFSQNGNASGNYYGLSGFGPRWFEIDQHGSFGFTNGFTANTPVTNATFGEIKALTAGGNGGNIYAAGWVSGTNGFSVPQMASALFPTNQIPLSTAGLTNWILLNPAGVAALYATNISSGGFLTVPIRNATLLSSNFTVGNPFTNNYGVPCITSIGVSLTLAAVIGTAKLDVRIAGTITNSSAMVTLLTGGVTGVIPDGTITTYVPVGGILNVVDASTGAGNSAVPSNGQIQY